MPLSRIPQVEIETLDDFDSRITGVRTVSGWTIQSVDLTERATALSQVEVAGALFLGCRLTPELEDSLTDRGALVFPSLPDVPFNPYVPRLYTAADLYDGVSDGLPYAESHDGQTYAWYTGQPTPLPIEASLAMSLHDHAIGEALDDLLETLDERRIVGVMGGHKALRGDAGYADAARLGALLAASGRTVATGGGPGAMEAANLGALFAGDTRGLAAAIARISAVPDYRPDIGAWARAGLEVVEERRKRAGGLAAPATGGTSLEAGPNSDNAGATPVTRDAAPLPEPLRVGDAGATPVTRDAPLPEPRRVGDDEASPVTLGVPTWFFGHEPPNVFATNIAKYFSNALREDVLLQRCRGGLVYLPGAAGTVQEVFQEACRNYYAPSADLVTPMVLVGRDYWTRELPVWPLLRSLAADRAMDEVIHLVDTVDEAAELLTATVTPYGAAGSGTRGRG